MYGWIWRKLPGGWPLKTLESIVLVGVVCAALVVVVFPWVEPKLPFSGNTVTDTEDQATPTGSPTATPTATTPRPTDVPTPNVSDTDDFLPGD